MVGGGGDGGRGEGHLEDVLGGGVLLRPCLRQNPFVINLNKHGSRVC